MAALISNQNGRWLRQELPNQTCNVLLAGANEPLSILLTALPEAPLPAAALGMLVICSREEAYFLRAAGTQAYLNAEAIPTQWVRRLRDHDRITMHRSENGSVRLWYAQNQSEAGSHPFEGAESVACGYCCSKIGQGEAVLNCSTCGETLHCDCLAHAGDHCPRCGLALAATAAGWAPPGFSLEEVEYDE